MPLLDLVTPWAAAADAEAEAHLRRRHAALLERVRRQRAPHADALPLLASRPARRALAQRVGDPAWQQRLRDLRAEAADAGADVSAGATILPAEPLDRPGEPLPGRTPEFVLALDVDDEALVVQGVAHALAALTRWCAADSLAALGPVDPAHWSRWDLARERPLGEWCYLEGLGVHLAVALRPDWPIHRLLGVSVGAYHRLRERERALRELLAADLPHQGLGPMLRWLEPGAPASARTVAGTVVPPLAGRYLAWRLTAERVARVGLRAALRMAA